MNFVFKHLLLFIFLIFILFISILFILNHFSSSFDDVLLVVYCFGLFEYLDQLLCFSVILLLSLVCLSCLCACLNLSIFFIRSVLILCSILAPFSTFHIFGHEVYHFFILYSIIILKHFAFLLYIYRLKILNLLFLFRIEKNKLMIMTKV